jgi:hypothetical protein
MHLKFIFDIFKENVKVIHIIRDGRDVVMSHHKQLGKFMTPKKWNTYVRAGLLYKDDPRVLTVFYEDLISGFDGTMSQISEFLEIKNIFNKDFYLGTSINDNKSIISGYGYKDIYKAKPLSGDSISKWKDHPDVMKAFLDYEPANELLKMLGYRQ